MENYFNRAIKRAQRRKSIWNLLLFILDWFFWLSTTFFFVKWLIEIFVGPDIPFSRVARSENDLPMIFLVIPVFLFTKPLSSMMANLVMVCIPSARKAFDREASQYKGTSFSESMRGLFWVAVVIGCITVPIALIAAYNLKP